MANLVELLPVGRCLVEVKEYGWTHQVVASSVEPWLSRAGEPLLDGLVVVHEQTGRRQHLGADRVRLVKLLDERMSESRFQALHKVLGRWTREQLEEIADRTGGGGVVESV